MAHTLRGARAWRRRRDATLAFAAALGRGRRAPTLVRTGPVGRRWCAGPRTSAAYDRAFAAFFVAHRRDGDARRRPSRRRSRLLLDTDESRRRRRAPTSSRSTGRRFACAGPTARCCGRKDFARCTADRARRGPPAHGRPPPRRRPRAVAPPRPTSRRRGPIDLRRHHARARSRTGGEPLRTVHRGPATGRGGWCCCVTCRARWSPTPGRSCASPTRGGRPRPGRGVRPRHAAAPASPVSSRSHDPDAALDAAAGAVADWSGGTRLGEGLRTFNDRGAARHGARRDRGDPLRRLGRVTPSELGRAGAAAARVAHRVVWVNPLKASPGYAPLARGMAAALPVRRRVRRGPLARAPGGARRGDRAVREILRRPRAVAGQGKRVALARVVDIEGSGPRDPGAAMAVTEDGEVVGSVSGGCVEGAVVTEALDILATGEPAARDVRLQRRRGLRRRPHLRRHGPPLRRAPRLGVPATLAAGDPRPPPGRPGHRGRWPRRRATRCSSSPASTRSGSSANPDLDRVVQRDARRRWPPAHACAATAPRRGHEDTSPCSSRRSRRRRGCSSSAPSTSPPRSCGWPRCSATGSRCAMPARCSPPRLASRWPTRSSSTGPTATWPRSARPRAARRRVRAHPRRQVRRARDRGRAGHRRRLHRRHGLAPHHRAAHRPAAGRGRRPTSSSSASGAHRARPRCPHPEETAVSICAEIIAHRTGEPRPASATATAPSTESPMPVEAGRRGAMTQSTSCPRCRGRQHPHRTMWASAAGQAIEAALTSWTRGCSSR